MEKWDDYHVGDVFVEAFLQLAEETAIPVVVIAALNMKELKKWNIDYFHFVISSQ